MEIRASSRVLVGAFELNLRAGELRRGEEQVVLQEQPLQVLLMLVEARGEIVTRAEIKQRLWPNDTVVEFDHSIHTAINKLRKALGDSADNPSYIQTVARRGYRLMVPVEWASSPDDSSGEESSAAVSSDSSSAGSDDSSGSDSETVPKAKLKVGRLTGNVVSHYRVLDVIGGGGMGLVYRAEDLKLGRAVALKFLPEEVGDDPKARERFEREARAVSALNHFNICTVHDFEEHEGYPFIAMELLQGKTLREHLADGCFRSIEAEGLEIAIQIASGLEAAHEKGIIHRDIKPANIFITEKNVAKILDFGVAKVVALSDSSTVVIPSDRAAVGARVEEPAVDIEKVEMQVPRFGMANEMGSENGTAEAVPLQTPKETTLTRTGMKLGTAGYMSPEQVRGEPLDARTDIFSFGLVLYEMAAGERAFTGNTIVAINDAILHRTPRPVRESSPKASAKLETIITKCLEKDRERRYQSTSQVKAELQQLLPRAAKSRWLWAAAIALLLVSALAIWMASSRPKPAPEPKFTQLTSNFNENPIRAGAISPDKRYLAYADLRGVHLRDLKTGETRDLNSPSVNSRAVFFENLDWWPDGSAVIGNDVAQPERQTAATHSRIWLMPVSGDPPRVLRENGEFSAISPDGKSLLFHTKRDTFGYREVWQVDAAGGQEQLLLKTDKDSAAAASFWLGEDRLAYFIVDKLGATVQSRLLSGGPSTTALTFQDPAQTSRLQALVVLRNGRTFYVLAEPGSNNFYCTLWETQIDPRTGKLAEEPHKVASRTRSCITLDMATADGQKLLFLEWSPEESIYVADLDVKAQQILNPQRITPSEAYRVSAWTGDSKQVIYTATNSGRPGIYRQTISGDRAESIVASYSTHHLGGGSANYSLNSTYPRSTPDGNFVLYTVYTAYNEYSATPHRQILRVPVAGGASEVILSGDFYGPPDCSTQPYDICVFSERSQDGTQIVFSSLDALKGRGRQVASFASHPKADYRWRISPQADRLALVNNQDANIDVLSLHGRPARQITVKGHLKLDRLSWTSDGNGFYVSTMEEGRSTLLYVDLHGNARTIWEEKGGLGTFGIPSPDGRHIALQSWTLNTNLWSMENF